jgi:hypothetical protein
LHQFKPPAREEKKQALEYKITFACNIDVKHKKHLSISLLNDKNVQQTIRIENID